MDYRGRFWRDYFFDPPNKQVIFRVPEGHRADDRIDFSKLLIITNVTTGDIIYSPHIEGKGGTFQGFTLTLDYDTTSMNKSDYLQIIVEIDWANLTDIRTISEARDQSTLTGILKTLLKIEKHLEIINDEQIEESDIGGPGQKRK